MAKNKKIVKKVAPKKVKKLAQKSVQKSVPKNTVISKPILKVAKKESIAILAKPSIKKEPNAGLKTDALEKYKAKLLQLQTRLNGDIQQLQDDSIKKSQRDLTGELSGYSMHIADAGADDFDRTISLSVMGSEQEILYEIDGALKRIEDKVFGLCEICEKPLPLKRLDAIPYATLCIRCQEGEEKTKE